MKIGGIEYKFAYTIGAASTLQELKANEMNSVKQIMLMAVVLNKAYNDIQRLEDPSYSAPDLTLEEVQLLSMSKMTELNQEIESAVKRDSEITVNTKPAKGVKKNQAAEG